jgi:uncharacterized protein (DUF1499 family)
MGTTPLGSAPPSRTLDVVGLVAVGLIVLGPLLAWLRLVPALVGFVIFALGGLVALVVTVIAVVRAVRGRGFGRAGTIAAALAALAFIALATRGGGSPMINDFTTDLVDPPAFTRAAAEPANAGRDLSYPAAFADEQRACCEDLTSVRVAAPPAAAFAIVETIAGGMPDWTITRKDAAAGELEAVATSRIFGFADDVVVRVRPDPASGSRVDVRSKSRDGKGDRGVNAARIRAFRAALTARANAGTP